MNRSTSIKYRPAGNVQVTRTEKRSLNTYNHDTDNDIFALGDAAEDAGVNFSQFDIPDDLFKDFGTSLEEALQKQLGRASEMGGQDSGGVSFQVNTTTTKKVGDDGHESETTQEHNGGYAGTPDEAEKGDIQVSTITKTLPDGRTVHTRIMRGPVKTRRRIIKINRELPSGETELLGTYEAQGGGEGVEKTVKFATDKLVPSLMAKEEDDTERDRVTPIPTVVEDNSEDGQQSDSRRMSMDGDYDNAPLLPSRTLPKPRVFPSMSTKSSTSRFLPSQQPLPQEASDVAPDDQTPGDPGKTRQSFQQANSFPSPHPPLHQATSLPASSHAENQSQSEHLITPPTGKKGSIPSESLTSQTDLRRKSRSYSLPMNSLNKRPSMDDEVFEMYNPETFIHEVTLDEDDEAVCPSCKCCPKIWTRRKKRISRTAIDVGKGKLGMTQSEINTDEKELPGLNGLVANYARMLFEDKPGFLETLFRAVKLNKLDVVKILCKIIQKSGLKLASRELREQESSATILHVALLYNHTEIVDYLLRTKESGLIMAKYENDQYRNQTGLHVAVANGNPEMVEKLLLALDNQQRQVLINTIADGNYFKKQHPHGQLCLTAAAWAGNCDIIKMLVQYGGNLTLKSHNGNTLLHSIVVQSAQFPSRNNYEQVFQSVLESAGIWADQMVYGTRNIQQRELEQTQMQINLFKELLAIRNNDGYTPLALATTNSSKLFGYMLNLEKIYKIPQNKLGSITWVTYDVTDVTSFAYNTYNKFSVLHILAHNSQRMSREANGKTGDQRVDYLDMEPIKALLACKWSVYRLIYIAWLVIHLTYMIMLTAATAESNSTPYFKRINETVTIYTEVEVHYGFVFFIFLPILYIILELLDLWGNRPYRISFMKGQHFIPRLCKTLKSEWTITGNGPYRMVNIGFSVFVIDWFLLYIMKDENQDMSLSVALLLGWVFVLFFTRGCRVTSRFSIMIQQMFFRDLIYFLTVYGIILIGFSFAMNAMFTYKHDAEVTISKVFYDMMNVVTDLDKKQSIDDARNPLFAKLLLIFYAIVAVILLMNMLIAMMNTSYETVRVTRCNLWKQQQLSIMLMLERRLFWWKWLCRKSEGDVWRKEAGSEIHSYLDVTVLHTNHYTAHHDDW